MEQAAEKQSYSQGTYLIFIQTSDFGQAKLMPEYQETCVTVGVLGTFGNFDPDYTSTGKLTLQSDVYAFGVVLLELLIGRRAVDINKGPNDQNLVLQPRTTLDSGMRKRTPIEFLYKCKRPGEAKPDCLLVFFLSAAIPEQITSVERLAPPLLSQLCRAMLFYRILVSRYGKRIQFRGFHTAPAPIGEGMSIILVGSGRVWI
ncbi:Detected protein of unknown function [Hibiscus syriacus]|uniref:Protein kinase domain-containing protein n=1 Tax=Hibiscus syriacus TaxID=106335 RepID=A0A6A3CAC7_HIBSY|nr:Detected protein of unknown function [Hibiscus syriacus]